MIDIAKILIVTSLLLLLISHHYFDTAINMLKHNLPLDLNLAGETRTAQEIYFEGLSAYYIAFLLSFIALILLILKERFSKPFQRKW